MRAWLVLAACVTASLGLPAAATQQPTASTPAVSGFAPIGDVRMYYEVHGDGPPILFVHGGGGSTASWPPNYVESLSRDFKVILTELRGHGRTADGSGPITYGRLTHDVVRLLDHLGIDRAHIVGHSVGAIVGLHLLVDFPDRVDTAVLLAGAYHVDNYEPAAHKAMMRDVDALIRGEKIENWLASRPVPVLKKLRSTLMSEPTFTFPVLETIERPTLIVAAGGDTFFAPAVARQMHAHIRNSELLVFPDATHRVQVTNARELVPALRDWIRRRGGKP